MKNYFFAGLFHSKFDANIVLARAHGTLCTSQTIPDELIKLIVNQARREQKAPPDSEFMLIALNPL